VGFYKPTAGAGDYTMNRVSASASNGSGVFQDPETTTDLYYISGVARWYGYLAANGIFNLTDTGGAGTYNATLNDCEAAVARSHCLNIANLSGTTVINGGFYGHAGQDNIRITSTGVTLTGTAYSRLRSYLGNRSSSGVNIRILAGAVVTLMEWVDSDMGTGVAAGGGANLRLEGTITSMNRCRFGVISGGSTFLGAPMHVLGAGTATITNSTFHAAPNPNAINPVLVDAAATGALSFTNCIFTSANLGQVQLSGAGAYSIATSGVPTDGDTGESLNTATPVVGTSPTGSITQSPTYLSIVLAPPMRRTTTSCAQVTRPTPARRAGRAAPCLWPLGLTRVSG